MSDQLEELRELFCGYDSSGDEDGTITIDEFEALSKDPRFQFVLDSIPFVTTANELFLALDDDGDGKLEVDEFVRGVNLCRSHPTSLDMCNCLTLLRKIREDHNSLYVSVKSLMEQRERHNESLGDVKPPARFTIVDSQVGEQALVEHRVQAIGEEVHALSAAPLRKRC